MAAGDESEDPDRVAILARRQRFIALAISGLATAGCKTNAPEPCLSMVAPNDVDDEAGEPSGLDGPIVEDPGAPLENGDAAGEAPQDSGSTPEPEPKPCLNVVVPQNQTAPRPCLDQQLTPAPCLSKI